MPPPVRGQGDFISTPHTVPHSGTPIGGIDPKLLLAPRTGQTPLQAARPSTGQTPHGMTSRPKMQHVQPTQAQFTFSSPTDSPGSEVIDLDDPLSQSSLLDRIHNTEDRSVHNPQNQIKRSESPARSSTWTQGGGGGVISDHMRDKRKEAAMAQARSPGRGAAENIRREIESSSNSDDGNAMIDLTKETIDLTVNQPSDHAAAVDLTQDDGSGSRSFYVVNGQRIYYDSQDYDEQEVCYGRIEGARINCHLVPDTGRQISSRGEWPPMAVDLKRAVNKSSIVIKAYDPRGRDFGSVDPRTSLALKQFLDGQQFRMRLEARTDTRIKKQFEAPGQATSESIAVHINVFGPRRYAINPVGKALSQQKIWLRTPKTLPHNKELFNPHCNDPEQSKLVKKATMPMKLAGSTNAGFKSRTVEEAQYEVQSLFDNLQKHDDLPMAEADSNVTSKLLGHQQQALYWMLARERPIEYEPGKPSAGTLWRCEHKDRGTIWHHVITGHEIKERPRDTLGGLLADMMGLGKTLSILSLLSFTRPDALDFQQNSPQVPDIRRNVQLKNLKATLIVCPVSVITNWEDQIMQHIREGGLTYYSYHGSSRKKDVEYLSQFDVILTSYAVVKSEMFPTSRAKSERSNVLSAINFFRVVLDEAHTIRTQNTQQFLACIQLNAVRRWALTATPVQNKLEDMGAIIRFLRIYPFDVDNFFNRYITNPFKVADPQALAHLRILVDSVTLRRLKDTIDLAPRQDETVMLGFSEQEQTLYNFFASDASRRLSAMTAASTAGSNLKLSGKGYMNILRSILCLRQICAHGANLLRDEDMLLIEGQSSASAIDVEEEEARPALDERQAYGVFELLKETNAAMCAKCNKNINTTVPEVTDDEDETFCNMLPCYQLVCNECTKELEKETKRRIEAGDDRMKCPFCELAWRISLFAITASGMERAERRKEDLAREPKKAKMLNRYEGPSSKTVQLINRLYDAKQESVTLEADGEMPIKSVVFSAWTTHLDLISIALDREGIEYCTLVGSMSRKQRREALDEFRTSRTANVFLVSIGTGGVGLNLTAASRVYLMDIGFNPMAEQQAIDRVHRLGQTRKVTFTRFLMQNSIEVKILELQKKKMDLADLSLQRGKVDRAEAVRARLEELKALFR